MFNREKLTFEIEGKEIILQELSSAEFNDILQMKDETEQAYTMIVKSMVTPKVTIGEVKDFPNRIVTEILDKALKLNGTTETGN